MYLEGYVFTGICDSVHRGSLCPNMHHRPYKLDKLSSLSGGGLCLGVSGGSLSGGSLTRGSLTRGVSVRGDPPYGNERAVRILLECILVWLILSTKVSMILTCRGW